MGQYHHPTNIDDLEGVHPHALGDGLKLMEFGQSGWGTMLALGVLIGPEGRWAGKRIAIIGDYVEPGDLKVNAPDVDAMKLYSMKGEHDPGDAVVDDVTAQAVRMLVAMGYWSGEPDSGGWATTDGLLCRDREYVGPDGYIVNLDRDEILKPDTFGDSTRIDEFIIGGSGSVMTALSVLLSCSNGRGGGDYHGNDDFVGRWAGQRITIATDLDRPMTDVSREVRAGLEAAGEGKYEVAEDGEVTRVSPW